MDVMALAAHAAATVAACCRLVACVLPYRTAITAVPRCRTPACIADAWMFAPSPLCRAAAHTCLAGPLMIVPSSRMQPRAPCIPSLLLALRMLLLCCRIHPRSRTTTGALTRSRPPRQVFLCSFARKLNTISMLSGPSPVRVCALLAYAHRTCRFLRCSHPCAHTHSLRILHACSSQLGRAASHTRALARHAHDAQVRRCQDSLFAYRDVRAGAHATAWHPPPAPG